HRYYFNGGGGPGTTSSGMTQDDRSNSINSSAFSCGDSSTLLQLIGTGIMGLSFEAAPTWRALNTTRPHKTPSGARAAAVGVLNEKYWVAPMEPGAPTIHGCETSCAGVTSALLRACWIGSSPFTSALLSISHCCSARPLGKVVTMLALMLP